MALATRPKPTARHHKKRQAGHHRHSKPYLKTYWPYLPMLMIVVVGLMISNLWTKNTHVLGTHSDYSATTLLQVTNINRASSKEHGLTLDSRLSAAAEAKAQDMIKNNYWAHNNPTGQTPWGFITAAGYNYQLAGENLAYGFSNAEAVITGWMNSPDHRANILNGSYTNVGFGVVNAVDYLGKGPTTLVVAEYGEPQADSTNVNFTVSPPSNNVTTGPSELKAHPVSRIELLTGGAAWSGLALSALAGAALMLFVLRHSLGIKRALSKGEQFVVHHPWLDIAMVLIFTIGFVLTRASGVIR